MLMYSGASNSGSWCHSQDWKDQRKKWWGPASQKGDQSYLTRAIIVHSYCYCQRQGPEFGREQGRNTLTSILVHSDLLLVPPISWSLPKANVPGSVSQVENGCEEGEWRITLSKSLPFSKFQFINACHVNSGLTIFTFHFLFWKTSILQRICKNSTTNTQIYSSPGFTNCYHHITSVLC